MDAPTGSLLFKPFGDPENAKPPQRMSAEAVGYDFYAEEIIHEDHDSIWYRTGYGVRIPVPFFGDLRARSSVSKTGLVLANGCGVVDPDYRGEVQFRFYKTKPDQVLGKGYAGERVDKYGTPVSRRIDIYEPGERIGQMVIVKSHHRHFAGTDVVDEWPDDTERGEGGFGSTGED